LLLGLWVLFPSPRDEELLLKEVVSGHVRSMMVTHLTDVATSDRHVVKPWYSGKLDFAPTIVDQAEAGFALVGGRLDYLADRPVAALVYRHDQHIINLYTWPSSGKKQKQRFYSQQGFSIFHWANAGMEYWAISDLNATDLQRFVSAIP
jgi:anti-sigma factor RsiW